MHTSVLLNEVLEGMDITKGEKYIDATFGEGGHSFAIEQRGGIVLALDWDNQTVIRKAAEVLKKHITLICANFKDIEHVALEYDFGKVSGVLFDFGLSMEQIARGKRGFSFKAKNELLDMRINNNIDQRALDIVNRYTSEELTAMFINNAEEVASQPIALSIVINRKNKPIKTVGDLIEIVGKVRLSDKESTYRRIFQALRIEVNHEFENIAMGLTGAFNLLKSNGKCAVITFHSLEDRIVKKWISKHESAIASSHKVRAKSGNKFEKTALLRIIQKI